MSAEMQFIEVITQMADEIHKANVEKGFWDEGAENKNFGEVIALVHSELSEALEADRTDEASTKIPGYSGVEEELADAIIRILDCSSGFGLSVGAAVIAKLQYNKSRPRKHGKKY